MAFIEFKDVYKEYKMGMVSINALDGASFTIEEGELVIIAGQSGAGKTTALNILGGMDNATLGKVTVNGRRLDTLNPRELTNYRRQEIGYVFQYYNLLQNLTALENVELANELSDRGIDSLTILDKVGLGGRINRFPAQLSGGEQQRVAIARALAKNPRLLLCDEPTGALDSDTGKQILQLLQETCRGYQMTVVIVTHNTALIPMADKVIFLKNGRVERISVNDSPTSVELLGW